MQLAMRVRVRWPVWLNAAVAVCGDAYAGFLVLGGMQRALTSGDLTVALLVTGVQACYACHDLWLR